MAGGVLQIHCSKRSPHASKKKITTCTVLVSYQQYYLRSIRKTFTISKTANAEAMKEILFWPSLWSPNRRDQLQKFPSSILKSSIRTISFHVSGSVLKKALPFVSVLFFGWIFFHFTHQNHVSIFSVRYFSFAFLSFPSIFWNAKKHAHLRSV